MRSNELRQILHILSIIIFSFILLSSCAYGPKTEKKSKLNYLSGEHYEGQGPTITNVPKVKELPEDLEVPELQAVPLIYKRKAVPTVISGTVLISEFQPLKFKLILLKQDNKTILKTTSDHLGAFRLSGSLPNGEYIIIVDTDRFEGEHSLLVDKYIIENVIITVKEKPLK